VPATAHRVSLWKVQRAGAFSQPCRLPVPKGPHVGELGCACWRLAGLQRAQSPASKHTEGSLQLGKDKLTLLNVLGPVPRLVSANEHLLTSVPVCTKQGCCRALSKLGFCKGRKIKPKINVSLMVNPSRKPNTAQELQLASGSVSQLQAQEHPQLQCYCILPAHGVSELAKY